ncbi:MAG: hypothetical protein SOU19_00990 [Candidatus Caccosoma sp.]|mgnify:FL=1|nr:hypothetical protein [Candidatus Caccosoma sp.]
MEYKTKHYIFSIENNEIAKRDIKHIAKIQEDAYEKITKTLKIEYDSIIKYYLLNSPEEVAKLSSYDYPVNGLANIDKKCVYAVYNEDVKCIGPHEDAHLISEIFGITHSDFLSEGLAMFFDETWWNIKNEIWCKRFVENKTIISPLDLLNDNSFYEIDCAITYPIAGAFTAYLIKQYGIDKYKVFYTLKDLTTSNIEKIFECKINDIVNNFIKYINENN